MQEEEGALSLCQSGMSHVGGAPRVEQEGSAGLGPGAELSQTPKVPVGGTQPGVCSSHVFLEMTMEQGSDRRGGR